MDGAQPLPQRRGSPDSFKGFAASFAEGGTPACGKDWTTDPGNSSVRIAVVAADPGYSPNPGRSGTGEIIALDTCLNSAQMP